MIRCRPAQEGDVEAMAAVHAASWRAAYAGILPPDTLPEPGVVADLMRERLPEPERSDFVAELDGRVCGFCGFGKGEIYVLYVDPAAWRRGAGSALVALALAELGRQGSAEVTLWSAALNDRANAFYEAAGFTRDGTERTRPEYGDAVEVRYRRALP